MASVFLFFGRRLRAGKYLQLAVLALLPAGICLFPFAALSEGEIFKASRPFHGLVRRDMAEQAALVEAELTALQAGAALAARTPIIQYLVEKGTAPSLEFMTGAARRIFRTEAVPATVSGFPPDMRAEAGLRLIPPADLGAALKRALAEQDITELHALALARRAELLRRYDEQSAVCLASAAPAIGGGQSLPNLRRTLGGLSALDLYVEALAGFEHGRPVPVQLKGKLKDAFSLSPDEPLILAALAEIAVQEDDVADAAELADKAIRLLPAFARAYDVRGAVLLRRRVPSLAAESFSRAVELAPQNPVYRMHRGSAFLVLEDYAGMCEDFAKACVLGVCEGQAWAHEKGMCAGAPAASPLGDLP